MQDFSEWLEAVKGDKSFEGFSQSKLRKLYADDIKNKVVRKRSAESNKNLEKLNISYRKIISILEESINKSVDYLLIEEIEVIESTINELFSRIEIDGSVSALSKAEREIVNLALKSTGFKELRLISKINSTKIYSKTFNSSANTKHNVLTGAAVAAAIRTQQIGDDVSEINDNISGMV